MRKYSIEEISLARGLLAIGCNYLYRNENNELCGHELFPRKENGLWVFTGCQSIDGFTESICVDLHGRSNESFKELQYENGKVLSLVEILSPSTRNND